MARAICERERYCEPCHSNQLASAVTVWVADQTCGFYGRMQLEKMALIGRPSEIVDRRILPNVGPVPAMTTELDVVAMWAAADLKTAMFSYWLR